MSILTPPTTDQVADLLQDFPALCSLFEIGTKERGRRTIRFHYEDWYYEQQEFERERTGRDVILKPRQIGFSTLELARDLWFAIRYPGSNVSIMAQRPQTVRDMLRDMKLMAQGLAGAGLLPAVGYDNVGEWTFPDIRSKITIEVAGKSRTSAEEKGRGGAIHRFHGTEVATWGNAATETWNSVEGALTPDAEVCLESTANGSGNLFYNLVQAARRGESGYRFHFYPWFQHREYSLPLARGERVVAKTDHERRLVDYHGISAEQLKWYRKKANARPGAERLVRQEYPEDPDTCFLTSGRTFIPPETLDILIAYKPLRLASGLGDIPAVLRRYITTGQLRIFRRPMPEGQYVLGGDPAEGIGGDETGGVLIDALGNHVASVQGDGLAPDEFATLINHLGRWFNNAGLAIERNNHGHAVLLALRKLHYPRIWPWPGIRPLTWHDMRPGWVTSPVTRPLMLDEMDLAIRSDAIRTFDGPLIVQLKAFVVGPDGKAAAEGKGTAGGATDDLVISLAIAWYVRSHGKGLALRGFTSQGGGETEASGLAGQL